MGGPFLSAVLVIVLSDSAISHGIRRTGAALGGADAVQVPASHGSVEKFDSSPALRPLLYDPLNSPGGHDGPANMQRPPASFAKDAAHESNHPALNSKDHPPFQAEAAAQLAKLPFGEPWNQLPKYTIDHRQFHPTHSFFGCEFFGGCPDDASSPPLKGGMTKATDSFTSGSSGDSNDLISDVRRLPTSTVPAQVDYGNTAEGVLQNGTKPAHLVTDATVNHSTVSPLTRGPPPVDNLQLTQAATTESHRQRAGTVPRAVIIATDVSDGTSNPPSTPDMSRGTDFAPATSRASKVFTSTAATTLGENGSRSMQLLSTTATSEGVEAAHSTQDSASSATPLNNFTLPSSLSPTATIEVMPRLGLQQNATEAVPSGHTTGLTTQSQVSAFNDSQSTVKPTTSGESSTAVRREESSNPLPLPTQALKTTPNSTPEIDSSNPTTLTTLLATQLTEITTPSPAVASNDSATRRQTAFEKSSSNVPTAPAMHFSVEVAPRSFLNESTAQIRQETATAGLTPTETASPLTPTAAEGRTEANAFRHSVPTESIRHATTVSTTPAPDKKSFSETSERAAAPVGGASTKRISFQQTRPPLRPVPPPEPTAKSTALPDAYVRPITLHSTDQFVPHHNRDIEEYFTVPGHMEQYDHQRLGQCGKCQHRLHNCVQKCFLHYSCEAKGTELSCPRINVPCMPPFKHEVDQCRHNVDCDGANHLCCLVGCSRRCIRGVSP